MSVREKIIQFRDKGLTWPQIAEEIIEDYPELTQEQRYNKARNLYRGLSDTEDSCIKQIKQEATNTKNTDLLEVLKKGTSLKELSNNLGVSVQCCESIINDLKAQGYNIQLLGDIYSLSNIVFPSENIIDTSWNGNKIIRFGLMGDTQINSKFTQLTYLHKFYEICRQEGITTIYHTGDLDEGEQMRIGHPYECYEQGFDDHVSEIVRVYPKVAGIQTQFIIGNHDAAHIKRCGCDIGIAVARQREDMIYLGNSYALIKLTPSCTMELRHPIDGTSYALSYKIQKMIESISDGEKPNLLAVGHYHKAEYLYYRNVHAFQTASFQAQTPFMRGKGISAAIGGWVVELALNDAGEIEKITPTYIPFGKAIVDDWRSFR